jgi:undecaprenyl-diphosphatase
MITYFQAIVMGLIQGISELFPISSIGHSVIIPWIFGWHNLLASQSRSESFFVSFLVVLHVGTALALLIFYRRVWVRIIKGFFRSVRVRQIDTPDGRLAWLLIVATIPAGLTALALQNVLRTQFAKPLSAIIFLFINGLILLLGDRAQRKKSNNLKDYTAAINVSDHVSKKLTLKRAVIIGFAQIGALFAGISRSGITIVSGLYSGLSHEDAARFTFLLATPIILGAGLVDSHDFFSSLDKGVRAQLLLGGLMAGIAAYIAVKFLDKYFQTKTLRPFAIYCLGMSSAMIILGLVRGNF